MRLHRSKGKKRKTSLSQEDKDEIPAVSVPGDGYSHASSYKKSLKDDYSQEEQDERNKEKSIQERVTTNWDVFFRIGLSFLAIVAIMIGLAYLWISDQGDEEEITVSREIADIAMALTHAQMKNIHLQNQNWADPDFITNNLTSVLAPKFSSLIDLDDYGHFHYSSYNLRIYTSNNLSQFLVIAQPTPSLVHWVIRKPTIIIDSYAMELRKTYDLKTLNRLLANANAIEGANSNEISSLVKQGTLIPLSLLVKKNHNEGFSPPKALALIRPGAENYLYNLPRYSLLGQNLIKRTLDLAENPSESDHAVLQQEFSTLARYPNLVLYSLGGIQQATEFQKALTLLAPNEKFLVAYLQFNAKGRIINSHLLMDDYSSIAGLENSLDYDQEASKENNLLSLSPSKTAQFHQIARINIDHNDPLFLGLRSLSTSRLNALEPIGDELTSLIAAHNQLPTKDFEEKFSEIYQRYLVEDNEQSNLIKIKINEYQQKSNLTPARFREYLRAADLGDFK